MEVLISGRADSTFLYKLLKESIKKYGKGNVVFYGCHTPKKEIRQLEDQIRIVYDFQISNDLPEKPDIEFLRQLEYKEDTSVLTKALFTDRKLVRDGKAGVYNKEYSRYTDDELLRNISARTKAINSLINDYDFKFSYSQQIAHLGGVLIYYMSKANGIPCFRAGSSRIKNKFIVHDGIYEGNTLLKKEYNKALNDIAQFKTTEEADEFIANVRRTGDLYEVVSDDQEQPDISRFNNALGFLRRVISDPVRYFKSDYYAVTPPVKDYYYKKINKLRRVYLNKLDLFDEYDLNDNYIYFPLQVQPELSIMIWGRPFWNFIDVARNISQASPISHKVVVNEHPNMYGGRTVNYYKKLKCIPKTKIIHPNISTNKIIKNADLTVTITSSAGLQTLINGKPTITLGRPGYSMIDSVQQCSDFEDLSRLVHSHIKNEKIPDMDEVRAYIAANLKVGMERDSPDFERKVLESIEKQLVKANRR